jgi:hypothetical protein
MHLNSLMTGNQDTEHATMFKGLKLKILDVAKWMTWTLGMAQSRSLLGLCPASALSELAFLISSHHTFTLLLGSS